MQNKVTPEAAAKKTPAVTGAASKATPDPAGKATKAKKSKK